MSGAEASLNVPASLILQESLRRFGQVSLTARGRSMFPTIVPGDVVDLVATAGSYHPGDVVLALLPNESCVIHRLVATSPYALTRGDNASLDDPPSLAILAKVTKVRRTPASRLRRYLWSHLFAWRRSTLNKTAQRGGP